MRWVWLFIPLLFASPLLRGETLRFVADPSCPYVCPDNEAPAQLADRPGIIYEILSRILEPAGFQIQFELLPYSRSLESVKAGGHDALMVTLRDDAPTLHYHNIPIAMARGCFVSVKENSWRYEGVESLDGIRFGGTLGYKYGPLKAYVDANHPETTMIAGDNTFERLLKMVDLGRLDATIEDTNVIQYKLKQTGLDSRLHVAGCLPPKVPLFVGVSPAHPSRQKISELIDTGLQRLDSSGDLVEIYQRYNVVLNKGHR